MRLVDVGTNAVAAEDLAGRRARFEESVVPHLEYLYSLALRLTGQRSDAEDIVQETLLRAFRAIDTLREPERARFWLTKIQYSAWHDRHRREGEHDGDLSLDDERFSLFDTLVEDDPFPYSDRLHLDFLDLFDEQRVCEALQRLHPAHRTALVLAYVYGFKAREIAELTGSPLGTVLARTRRGRRQLERALWDHAKERGLLRGEVRR